MDTKIWYDFAIKAISNLENKDLSISLLEEAISMEPDESWPYIKLAELVKDLEYKNKLLKKAITIDDNPWSYLLLIQTFIDKDDFINAIQTIKTLDNLTQNQTIEESAIKKIEELKNKTSLIKKHNKKTNLFLEFFRNFTFKKSEPNDIHLKVSSKKSISIICAVKNRKGALLCSLSTWMQFSEISKIVIVDWNSDPSLEDLQKKDLRIDVVRIKNNKYFNISKAYNIGLKNCNTKLVLKIDADYILNPYYNFFEQYKNLEPKKFVTGCFQDKSFHQNSFIFAYKKDILDAGAYNESFKDHGYEDKDLIERMIKNNCSRVHSFQKNLSIFHIPHSD